MREELIVRLGQLGLPPPAEDHAALDALLAGARRRLLAETGQSRLPTDLIGTAVDMAAGEYLFFRRGAGRLEGFDEQYAIRQLQQGDTSVTYAVAEGQSPFDTLVQYLCTPPEALLTKWRRMRW